ncbi:hypothetical protein [Nostoc sp. CENA543]|uniref:hypothetical protein n=1 Tax=Nostoc sp. CENA543 TaxID=1869241 RepID=UPI0012FFE010|nr:hypothetical protein [Nostoc sp. CENA543]
MLRSCFEFRQIATEQQPNTGKLTSDSGEIAGFGEIGVAVFNSAKLRQCKTRQ